MFFSILGAIIVGLIIKYYGKIKYCLDKRRSTRWVIFFLSHFILPKVSQWHALLTPFLVHDHKTEIALDVLMKDGKLYAGKVYQHYLTRTGDLEGILIIDPRRYDREGYLAAKSSGSPVDKEQYWRQIPSRSLYIFGDKIMNLNINHMSAWTDKAAMAKAVSGVLGREYPKLTIEFREGPQAEAMIKPKG